MIFELDRKDYPKAENQFNRLKTNTAIESILTLKTKHACLSIISVIQEVSLF